MRASEHYQAGQLREAVKAATDEVKLHPLDANRRAFLCELLCFTGELERADAQLDTMGHQDPQTMMGISLWRQLIRADMARQQFFAEGRLPEFLGLPTPVQRLHLEASILLRSGQTAEAVKLLAQAEEQRPKVTGQCDGQPFVDLRDLDDLTASFLEVLTSTGKYYWIPLERVELMEFRLPTRPRDLLWRRVHMIVRGGPEGEVYLPTLYPGSHTDPEDHVRLGRKTEWKGGDDAPVRGVGQRTFLVGEDARPILELKEITIAEGASQ